MIGQVVATYRIAEKIGEGGMGTVYRAEHVVLGSPVAIKILLPQWTRNRQVVERFFTEARAAGSIRHVGIVQIFDSGQLPSGQAYIVMELLLGQGLGDLLIAKGALAPEAALAIGGQILAALDAAHVMGVIHRDLKPDNIQLVSDPTAPAGLRAKLLDFGIAKLLYDDSRAATRSGQLLGTPSYMSPEQCAGLPVDARSDLYSVGCMLFEMLTGRAPFDQDGSDLAALHLHQPPPRLRSLDPSLPDELEERIDRMLAKAPEQRTPSAAWALAALERISLDALPLRRSAAFGAPAAAQPAPRTDPFDIDTGSETSQFSPVELDGTEPHALTPAPPVDDRGPRAHLAGAAPPTYREGRRPPRRLLPWIVLVVAVLIAGAAVVLIGRSAELPPPVAPR